MFQLFFRRALTALALALPMVSLTPQLSLAGQDGVTISNDSNLEIQYLYVSGSGNTDWGPDRLGQQTLRGGERKTFRFGSGSRGCSYDIRAVFANGRGVTERNLDLCRADIVGITPSAIQPRQ